MQCEQSIIVSVIVCTYNRVEYLEKCIESLKKQDYLKFEIIVVNGPSNDGTNTFLERNPEIKMIEQEELNGLSYARNLGINVARGDIIAFIDDDAVAEPNWIQYLVKGYSNDMVGGVGGSVLNISDNSFQFRNGFISRGGIPSLIQEREMDYNNPCGAAFNYIMGTNSSFKRHILIDAGLFDEKIRYYLDEADVCMRIIRSGYIIKHVDNAIVYHQMAEGPNRESSGHLNWYEIMKNSIYFTLKYFKSDISSYTSRPLRSMFRWIKHSIYLYINNYISLRQLLDVYIQLIKGTIQGFRDGLSYKHDTLKCDNK